MLLTTGLKQEAGQFFTPVPIAQFIIKSLPLEKIIDEHLKSKNGELLPYMIDYAAGSGHFITEYMHEVQNIIDQKDPNKYILGTKKDLMFWQNANYEWATKYIYGIEKDYRLVKVGKVGCYLHGDGLANVILSDGLGNFANTKDYKGILRKEDDKSKDNQQFDIILSNPPYSVSSFKQTTREFYTEKDFDLYNCLTDNSSEIECLFVERTKQLLKDGGIAGVILPSSILTNTGIYTKTRELLLKYFEIVAITELGSNTFMATGTNTVVLFLRRRNNYDCINLQKSVEKLFADKTDVTINNIETPVSKYVNYVWEDLTFDDYLTLLNKEPNDKVKKHDIFKEYSQKIKSKSEKEFWNRVLEIEKEKLYYFILAYHQKIVTVKTGEKDAEKQFLGYEFSNRRGSEGIHAIQRGKSIDECTHLFDMNTFDNPQKASTYIYRAFNGDTTSEIDDLLKDNVSRVNLLDMMTFDRVDFEKVINVKAKKKIKIESKWELKTLKETVNIEYGTRIVKKNSLGSEYPVYGGGGETFRTNQYNRDSQFIISRFGMSPKCVRFVNDKFYLNDSGFTVQVKDNKTLLQKYIDNYLYINQDYIYLCGRGVGQKNIDIDAFNAIKYPLPPLDIQQKIVDEIEDVEKKSIKQISHINKLKKEINIIINNDIISKNVPLSDVATMKAGQNIKNPNIISENNGHLYPCFGGNGIRGYLTNYSHEGIYPIIGRQGALCGNVCLASGKFYATEHAIVVTPKKNVSVKWLYYKLISLNLNQYAKGTAQPGLSVQNILKLSLDVPPLPEQQKIVTQIEKLEKQIAEAQAIIDNSKQQKQEILDKYLK